jgi:hypothetical protein
LPCVPDDRRKANHEQHRPAGRHGEEAIEREAEIDQHEHADRHDVGKRRHLVGVEMEGEAAQADEKDQHREEKVVRAPLLGGAPQDELKPNQGGQQKGDIAYGVDGLGQKRRIGAALAIEEDVLAKCHGPCPFDPSLQERNLPRRRFHRRTCRFLRAGPIPRLRVY